LEAGPNRVQEVIPVKRKNPCSLVDVKEVLIEALTCGRRGQMAAVGVDVPQGAIRIG
jgi:hypothetical protein